MVKKLIVLFAMPLPWSIGRRILVYFLGYRIHKRAKIGWSMIAPNYLEMGDGASIGHLTLCKNIDRLVLKEHASIGNLNWITGYPRHGHKHFDKVSDRDPSLYIGEQAAITHRHLIDCTDKIIIGGFSIMAGYRSQLLTHFIDIVEGVQTCAPINIGCFSFLGTGSVILAGNALPDFSVLGAGSVLNKKFTKPYMLYAGTPAIGRKQLPKDAGFFLRTRGFVD